MQDTKPFEETSSNGFVIYQNIYFLRKGIQYPAHQCKSKQPISYINQNVFARIALKKRVANQGRNTEQDTNH